MKLCPNNNIYNCNKVIDYFENLNLHKIFDIKEIGEINKYVNPVIYIYKEYENATLIQSDENIKVIDNYLAGSNWINDCLDNYNNNIKG